MNKFTQPSYRIQLASSVYNEACQHISGSFVGTKKDLAQKATEQGIEYLANRPIGWTPDMNIDSLLNELKAFLEKKLQPVGIGWLTLFGMAWPFIKDAIISLVSRILLNRFIS